MARSRLSHADAMPLWRARDISRVQAVLNGLGLLFVVVACFGDWAVGSWWLGPLVIAGQCGLRWCLRWGLRWVGRWAHQGLWWCIEHAQSAVQTWQRAPRRCTMLLGPLLLTWGLMGTVSPVQCTGTVCHPTRTSQAVAGPHTMAVLHALAACERSRSTLQQLHQQAVPSATQPAVTVRKAFTYTCHEREEPL